MIQCDIGKIGRFGNQLFACASAIGLARRYNVDVGFSKWKYAQYFQNPLPYGEGAYLTLKEEKYCFDLEQWDSSRELIESMDVAIQGYLQSSKYWSHCKDEIFKTFELNPDFVKLVMSRYEEVFKRPVIAISIRRGDYVNNPNYELLPIRYVIGALLEHFPDFRSKYNLLVFSDDLAYCKIQFQALSNVYFAEGSDIEDHALMRQCDHFITTNSTFSYWGAYLGRKPHSKIICPKYLFAGKLLEEHGDVNFFESDWTVFNHKNYKINLSDTTFTVPCFFDAQDRLENIQLSLMMLKEDFDTKIIVGENQSRAFSHLGDKYMKFNYPDFWRTKMLNCMAYAATTPIICNYDADIVLTPLQLVEATRLAKSGFDMIYPYDGRFARVPRSYYKELSETRDVGCLRGKFKGTEPTHNSVGGAVVWNRESFIRGGMENEFMISYAPEDQERFYRYHKLGFKLARIPGILYHIDHEMTLHSTTSHPRYKSNREEFEKEKRMTTEELQQYVDSWDFTSDYPETYHEDISDKTSPAIVYELLEDWIDFETIVDVGCGDCSWGYKDYTGLDQYPNAPVIVDLRKDFKYEFPKYDLALCLEVAEHLPEKSADTLIHNLTQLSDKILFSAAIPGQGGENHINEQWQSYWAKKFRDRGFYPFFLDLRDKIWNNLNVALYYRQNMILYTNNSDDSGDYFLDRVHPQQYEILRTT